MGSMRNLFANPLKQICFHFSSTIHKAIRAVERALHCKDSDRRVFVHFGQLAQRRQLTSVALNGAPRGMAMRGHVNPRGDHPFLPRHFAAQLVIHWEGHIAYERCDEVAWKEWMITTRI